MKTQKKRCCTLSHPIVVLFCVTYFFSLFTLEVTFRYEQCSIGPTSGFNPKKDQTISFLIETKNGYSHLCLVTPLCSKLHSTFDNEILL